MAARLGSVLCRPGCAAKVSMSARKPSLGVIFLTVLLDLLGFGLVMPFLALQARSARPTCR